MNIDGLVRLMGMGWKGIDGLLESVRRVEGWCGLGDGVGSIWSAEIGVKWLVER